MLDKDIKYLLFVSPDGNHNKYYRMIPSVPDDMHFTAEYGRVGATEMKKVYPASSFAKIYNEKICKGYEDKSILHAITLKVKSDFAPILDPSVKWLVDTLLDCANKSFKSTYTCLIDDVTEHMIQHAQSLLLQLETCRSLDNFNSILLELFSTIPRKMRNVNEHLATNKQDFYSILSNEQELLDFTQGQLKKSSVSNASANVGDNSHTYLDSIGVTISECSYEESKEVLKHMKRDPRFDASLFYKAFRVTNHKTDERFLKCLKKHNWDEKKDTKMYYHGSNNRNWDSLIANGPMVNSQAVCCGRMFGQGIYFAHDAEKSRRFTSMCDYVRDTVGGFGFIGIYKVAPGKPLHIKGLTHSYSYLTASAIDRMKKHSVYAHHDNGKTLYHDEIVIFKEEQMTIRYIVALKK